MTPDSTTRDSLPISIGKGNLGKVENKDLSWEELVLLLSKPKVDTQHTLPEYLALPKEEQDRLKNVGFFLGGHSSDGTRKGASIDQRSVLCLDVDHAEPEVLDILDLGFSGLSSYAFFAHTTRKHTEENPRIRIVLPLASPVPKDKFEAVSRIVASRILDSADASMEAVDPASFRIAQMMYLPSVCKDAEFRKIRNPGNFLNWQEVLDSFPGWENPRALPRARKDTTAVQTGRKPENPTEKNGVVGAFCRAYDVPSAIAAFLSDIYEPGDLSGSKPRYSYIGSSTKNGAIVEDDGLFLYSHHETDPCSHRLVNAFDLVRLQLFGQEDAGFDPDDHTALPSYAEMKRLCLSLPEVVEEMNFGNVEDEFSVLPDEETSEEVLPLDLPAFDLVAESNTPPPTFPVEIFGEFWGRHLKRWSENSSASIDFSGIALLVSAAALIGNTRRVKPKGSWSEPCILWAQLIADSGSNKSSAMDPIFTILKSIEREWEPLNVQDRLNYETRKKDAALKKKIWEAECDKASSAGEDTPMRPLDSLEPREPQDRTLWLADLTIEVAARIAQGNPRGLIVVRDELAGWYQALNRYSGGGSDRPFWLEAYEGRTSKVNRVKDGNKSILIDRLSIGLIGGIQPDKLDQLSEGPDDGLSSRFLTIWPGKKERKWTVSIPDDSSAFYALRQLSELDFSQTKDGILEPVEVPFSEEANRVYGEWYEARVANDGPISGLLASSYKKSDGHVARIALVLEHLWWCEPFSGESSPSEVSAEAVKAAIRFREEYLKVMQQRVFGPKTPGVNYSCAKTLAFWILRSKVERFNASTVRRARITGTDSANALDAALQVLLDLNWIRPAVQDRKGTKGGRPSKDYIVDPRVFEIE